MKTPNNSEFNKLIKNQKNIVMEEVDKLLSAGLNLTTLANIVKGILPVDVNAPLYPCDIAKINTLMDMLEMLVSTLEISYDKILKTFFKCA